MPTGDPFLVGRSGLISFQRSLNTTSHNIANVNTEGYSRQRVILETRYPTASGAGFIGNGVFPADTQRLFDAHAVKQVQLRTTSAAFFNEFRNFAEQIDNLLADQDAGLSPSLQGFFDATAKVADDPSSSAAREGMLSAGQSLVDRVQTLEQWLADLRDATNDKIKNSVIQINTLTSSIAQINHDISVAKGISPNSEPNDLLDQRDQKIKELSKLVSVSTVMQDDGMMNVYTGSGQTLVLGAFSTNLYAQPNPDDPQNLEVAYIPRGSGTVKFSISNLIDGGELGGALDFRSEVLIPSLNHLGRLTVALTMTFNAQHQTGMDANNNQGGLFFRQEPTVTAVGSYRNVPPSPSTITAQFIDATQLTADEYSLSYDGANFLITNLSTNQSSTLTPVGAGPYTLNPPIDGLQLSVDVLPNVGDRFILRPTRGTARQFGMQMTDARLIAAAGLLRTNASLSNLGKASITEATVTAPTNPLLTNTVVVDFRNSLGVVPGPADEYRVNGGAWTAYTGSVTLNVNGWTADIGGEAWDGDVFTIDKNISGISDNRNALAMTKLQTTQILNNGTGTYQDAYSQLVVLVGNQTQQSIINGQAQDALLQHAVEQRDSISGVNLDEEAANMLRFQQAYSAAAQVIATSDQMFQALISAVGR